MDSFPPPLLPSPLIFNPQVPTSHHTHLEATPTIFSPHPAPPLPPFPLILGPEGCRSVKAQDGGKRLGVVVRGERIRTFPPTPPGQDQPPPPASRRLSYNIHEPHEYAMFSLWGGGLTPPPPSPLPRLSGEAVVLGKRRREDPRCEARRRGKGSRWLTGGHSHRGARRFGAGVTYTEGPRSLEPGVAEPLTEDHAGDPGARGSASLCPGGRSGRAGVRGGGVGGGAEARRGGAGAGLQQVKLGGGGTRAPRAPRGGVLAASHPSDSCLWISGL
jgi:hypothetical protein